MSQQRPSDQAVLVTGLGMVTPVGHDVSHSCASIRAGIDRFSESQEFRIPNAKGHRIAVHCAAVTGITDGHRRFLRMLRMAAPACAEAVAQARLSLTDLERCGLYLCLPEQDRPGLDNRAEQGLAGRLGTYLGMEDLSVRSRVFPLGHAAIYFALKEAVDDLTQNKFSWAIVGAVDTYLDEMSLRWLYEIARLKSDDNVDGFIPGEGSAFLVLKRPKVTADTGITPLALVDATATALEPNSIYEDVPCKAEGLSETIRMTLSSLQGHYTRPGLVICDLNGERYRSMEWGLAQSRVFKGDAPFPRVWHPADCIGDTGAAAGPISICVGVVALCRGYAPSTSVLVWGGSDDGERGSACLHAITPQGTQ